MISNQLPEEKIRNYKVSWTNETNKKGRLNITKGDILVNVIKDHYKFEKYKDHNFYKKEFLNSEKLHGKKFWYGKNQNTGKSGFFYHEYVTAIDQSTLRYKILNSQTVPIELISLKTAEASDKQASINAVSINATTGDTIQSDNTNRIKQTHKAIRLCLNEEKIKKCGHPVIIFNKTIKDNSFSEDRKSSRSSSHTDLSSNNDPQNSLDNRDGEVKLIFKEPKDTKRFYTACFQITQEMNLVQKGEFMHDYFDDTTSMLSRETMASRFSMSTENLNSIGHDSLDGSSFFDESSLVLGSNSNSKDDKKNKQKSVKINPALAKLVIYCRAVQLNLNNQEGYFRDMSSIVEGKFRSKLDKVEDQIKLLDYTSRQILRSYPNGTRFDSSNYNPEAFWRHGTQMVALNFQMADLPQQLNMALFNMFGKRGFVPKPFLKPKYDAIGNKYSNSFGNDSEDEIMNESPDDQNHDEMSLQHQTVGTISGSTHITAKITLLAGRYIPRNPKAGRKEHSPIQVTIDLIKPRFRKLQEQQLKDEMKNLKVSKKDKEASNTDDINESTIKLINQTASSGLCPTFFNSEKNTTPPSKIFKIRFQELSFLRFRVVDSDRNDLLATNTIPLRAARWGLVSVPLLNEFHEKLSTSGVPSLLVYIENPKAELRTPMSSIRYFE